MQRRNVGLLAGGKRDECTRSCILGCIVMLKGDSYCLCNMSERVGWMLRPD